MRSVETAIRNYLIVGALIPVVLLWDPPPGPKTPVCTLPECKTRGSVYHENLNPHGNPCEDFYDFACGGWNKLNPRPSYLVEWTTTTKMQWEVLYQLKTILENPGTRQDSRDLQRIRKVYKVCMKIPSLGKGDNDFLLKNMDKVGRYPQASISDMHNGYVKLTGESPLFDTQIIAHTEHNDEPLLLFKEIKSPYGSLVHMIHWNVEQGKIYRTFLIKLMTLAWNKKQPALTETAITKIMTDVINFRMALNQISRPSMNMESDPLEPISIRALQQWYEINSKHATKSQIAWDTVVRNLYSGLSGALRLINPAVGLRRKAYFISLAKLLADTPEKILAYHMEIYFLERHMTWTPTILKTLNDLVIKMNGYTGYVRKDEMDKSLQCIDDINLDEAKGKLYVKHFFEKNDIPVVNAIFEEVRIAVKSDIMDSKWLDQPTKLSSVRQISDISRWIGYPPWYANPLVKPVPSGMKPAKVNAHLGTRYNRICVSAAFIKPPVFDSHLPDVINYGAIGTTIGHEMYHALNDCARFKNAKGEEKSWWSKVMREKCEIRKQCFIQEYSQLALEELKSLKLPSMKAELMSQMSDASKSVLEDQPDVMGLQASFHAYQAKLKRQPKACSVLPHFERYNCEQMFFISFANSLCGDQVPEIAYGIGRVHSPVRLRVNGAVSHNKDFGRVFGCAINDTKMNPEKKCNLWV